MANKIILNGLSKIEKFNSEKSNKFIPQITDNFLDIYTGIRKGATVKIRNGKSIRLIVDNNTINYKDISKIFPIAYRGFYVRETLTTNTLGDLVKENVIYIPKDMALAHNIQVIYRVKMEQYICNIKSNIE